MLSIFDEHNLSMLKNTYDFSHLAPPEFINSLTIPQDQYFMHSSSKSIRKIFYKVSYSPQESALIDEVQQIIQKQQIPQKFFTRQTILKHLYDCEMETQQCVGRLVKTYTFLRNPQTHTFSEATLNSLRKGLIYTYGMDKECKPIVIYQMKNFDFSKSLQENFSPTYFLMLVTFGIRAKPYCNEKYNCIFDYSQVSITSIPLKYLHQILEYISLVYCGFVERTFLYNTGGIQFVWKFLKKFIPEHARNTIFFLDDKQNKKFLQFISPEQLQQKYGGKAKNIFEYWPSRKHTHNLRPQKSDQSWRQSKLTSKQSYHTVMGKNDHRRMSNSGDQDEYFTMCSPKQKREENPPIIEKQQKKIGCKCRLF